MLGNCRPWKFASLCIAMCLGCSSSSPYIASDPQANLPLQQSARNYAVPDVSQLPEASTNLGLPNASDAYWQLTADQCRELACAHAPAARVILAASRGSNRMSILDFGHLEAIDRVHGVTARHLAREARNRNAFAALTLYYRLLEAELLSDMLITTVAEVDELVRTNEELKKRGFPESAEALSLRRQQMELRADYVRLRQAARVLNTELKGLLGKSSEAGTLVPSDRIQVTADSLDMSMAVQTGIENRADLQLLCDLNNMLDAKTASAIRQAAAGLVPAVAAVSGKSNSAALLAKRDDLPLVRMVIQELHVERRREAEKEIRTATEEWLTQQEVVAITKKKLNIDRGRLTELEARRRSGAAVEAEYRKARLDAIRTESELIREAVKWKLADIKARQAMGLLCP